jgi:hypothetical protein
MSTCIVLRCLHASRCIQFNYRTISNRQVWMSIYNKRIGELNMFIRYAQYNDLSNVFIEH